MKKFFLFSLFAVMSCVAGFAQKTYTFDLTDWATIEAEGEWGTAYATRTIVSGDVTVTFSKANHQTTTITECPVTKGEPITVAISNGAHITSATIELVQWTTKAQTVTLNTSTDGETFTATDNKSYDFQPFTVALDAAEGVVAVKYTFNSQKNQVGVKSISITTDESDAPAGPVVVVTPAAGDVTSLKDFTLKYDGSFFSPSGNEGADVVLMDVFGAVVATVTQDELQMGIDMEDLNEDFMPIQCRFSVPEVTTPGKYLLHLPAGAFYVGEDMEENAESYVEYQVIAPPAQILVDPAPGVVTSLQDFKFTCDQLYICPSSQDGTDLTITDADNNVVATITQDDLNMMIDEECLDETGWNVIASKAHLEEAITAPGTYTLNIPEQAFYLGETYENSVETHFTYTIEAGDPNEELAASLAGLWDGEQKGVDALSSWDWSYQDMDYTFSSSAIAEGNTITFNNISDWGASCSLTGTVDAATKTITFPTQTFGGWYSAAGSASADDSFFATISDDLSTITFTPWSLWYYGTDYQQTTSMVLTRAIAPEVVWTVTGNTSWTKNDGSASDYVADNNNVTLTKYVQGEKSYYVLSSLGNSIASDPTEVKFTVNENGSVNFTNVYYGGYIYYIENGTDDLYIEGESSMFVDRGTYGSLEIPYWYYDNYYSENVTEEGTIRFAWGEAPEFNGTVVLPETAATLYDLLEYPVEFTNAKNVEVTNFGLLGGIFDDKGEIVAIAMVDKAGALAGSCDVKNDVATVRFVRIEDVKDQAIIPFVQQRIGGFAQPTAGEATVYICSKSFKVDGVVYAESITRTYTLAGEGTTTGIANVATSTIAPVYDLQGRRVNAPVKGQLYIQNGQKIVK